MLALELAPLSRTLQASFGTGSTIMDPRCWLHPHAPSMPALELAPLSRTLQASFGTGSTIMDPRC
jgi:hypothetical protein